jgi:hypothetical protein
MPRRSDKTKIVTVAVLLGSALAGCSDIYYDRRETVSFAANDASASALATQIIDPWPPASRDRNVVGTGVRVAGAIERYRTCQIIQPKSTTTSGTYGAAPEPTQPGCTPPPASAASAVK